MAGLFLQPVWVRSETALYGGGGFYKVTDINSKHSNWATKIRATCKHMDCTPSVTLLYHCYSALKPTV